MSCGTLPTSSPGVGAFPGFPSRFEPLPDFLVSLRLLRIRRFCVLEFVNSAQHQPVCYLMSFFLYSEFISGLDALHTVLNSMYVHTLSKSKLQHHNRFFFVES